MRIRHAVAFNNGHCIEFLFFSESFIESSNYYRKMSKYKRLYELLDDLGGITVKIADLGNSCWEVMLTAMFQLLTLTQV